MLDLDKALDYVPKVILAFFISGAIFSLGFYIGINHNPVHNLEDQVWADSINKVSPNTTADIGVACSSAEHSNYNSSVKYHCFGMVNRGPSKFNIVFQAKCSEANNTKCTFKYWDRGSFLRMVKNNIR